MVAHVEQHTPEPSPESGAHLVAVHMDAFRAPRVLHSGPFAECMARAKREHHMANFYNWSLPVCTTDRTTLWIVPIEADDHPLALQPAGGA